MRIVTIGLIVILTVGLLIAPLPAEAQQAGKVYRISLLSHLSAELIKPALSAFKQELEELGYTEDKNFIIEERYAESQYERLPELAAELVRLKVDILVTHDTIGIRAAKEATTTIPIVMAASADAVENGLVASLARPGGNITGNTLQLSDIYVKLLELSKQTLPKVTRVGFLSNQTIPAAARILSGLQASAPALGVTIISLEFRNPEELESALEAAVREGADVLLIPDPFYEAYGPRITEFAAKNLMPVLTNNGGLVERYFGLIAYETDENEIDLIRRVVNYVDKILKGAKPADFPVQQPIKFNLVINLKTAKEIGLTIPPEVLFQATRVIR